MNRRIIHIGLHKTGTTFLQRHYFPELKNVSFQTSRGFFQKFSQEDLSSTLLISSENLSGIPWNDQWKKGISNDYKYLTSFEKAIENLHRIYPDSHIIIVFRKHGDFLISLYKQYVQEGGVLEFQKFYNEKGVIMGDDLIFNDRVDYIKKYFQKVDVLSFEDFKSEGIDYLDQYFVSLGIERNEILSTRSAHRSITGKKIELLRRINTVYPKIPKSFQNVLTKNHFTPRKILQSRMKYWNSQDPISFQDIGAQVNQKFEDDWLKIEELKWRK